MMKTFLIMTNGHGNWATSNDYKQKLSSRARETEHSWFEKAAKQDATPAVLCMYNSNNNNTTSYLYPSIFHSL